MVIARAAVSSTSKGIGRSVLRRVGSSPRPRTWRQIGRRGYASGHGHGEQQSSEIPWIIGSLAVTVPAAGYLLQQGTKKSDHGHGEHDEHHKEEDETEKEEDQPREDESEDKESKEEKSDEGSENKEPKEEKDSKDKSRDGESKEDGENEQGKDGDKNGDEQGDNSDNAEGDSDDSKEKGGSDQVKMSEDGYELPGPNAPQQINWNSSSGKGPGEGQKGQRSPSEKKGEKDSASDYSGAKHPYLDDPEKSKKGVGLTDTAKIHGTVDPKAPARGPKGSGAAAA